MTVRYLTSDEMDRVKAELGDTVVGLGAEPYLSIKAVWSLIRDNVGSSSVDPTTSSTTVSSAGPTTLTLASVSGLSQFDKVVLDADDARETVTIRNISGSVISVVCRKTHSGTYPVEKESALTLVRGLLADLAVVRDQLNELRAGSGIKAVDDVQFFGGADGRTALDEARREQRRLREELASMLNVRWILAQARGGGGTIEVY